MVKRNNTTKYILPALLAFVVVVSLVIGILYIHSYLMKQTVQERSSQLEEMLSQIRVNLDYGMETHWNLVTGIYDAIDGMHYNSEQELIQGIGTTEKYFQTDLYD